MSKCLIMKKENYLKIILLTAIMVIICSFANAQKLSIKGRIVTIDVSETSAVNTTSDKAAGAAKKGASEIEDNKTVGTKNRTDDEENNELAAVKSAVEFADVVLRKKDMSVVTGCATDKNGRFAFDDIPAGDYIIEISCIGYENKKISLDKVSGNVNLEDVQIEHSALALNELVVSASNVVNTPDKKLVLPTAYQVKSSTNGIDLLARMQLSRLSVDPLQDKITSSNDGEVQLRINGVKADIQQIKALKPEEIKRVEYHDDPSLRYGENVAVVIDYIVKRAVSGGYVGTDIMQSPQILGFNNVHLNAKFNHEKSEYGVTFWSNVRNLKGMWRENSETFNFAHDSSFTRVEQGIPSRLKFWNSWVDAYYNYQEGDKWFFNANFGFNYRIFYNNDYHSLLYPVNNRDNYVDMRDSTKALYTTPSVDLYFQKNFSESKHLIVDVVGTYIGSIDKRMYSESKPLTGGGEKVTTDIYSKVKGDKYSIIGETIYEQGLFKSKEEDAAGAGSNSATNGTATGGNATAGTATAGAVRGEQDTAENNKKHSDKALKLSTGARYYQVYANNDYNGTVDATTAMREGRAALFAELKGHYNKFNYSVGGYGAYMWTGQAGANYHRFFVYPKFKIGYNFSDNAYIRLTTKLDYYAPELSDLNNVEQLIDSLQIRRGNPNLKVYHIWENRLEFEWQKGMFTVGGQVNYNYMKNPIMEETLRENDKFVRTNLNQKSWYMINPELEFKVGPIAKIFTVSATAGMNHYDSRGIDYHHVYNNGYYMIEMDGYYKKFIVHFQINSLDKQLLGETVKSRDEKIHLIMLGYKITDDMSVAVGAINPFTNRNTYKNPTTNLSALAPSYSNSHFRESAQLFMIKFSWNFSFGRKYNAAGKLLQNSDTESSTLSGKK